MRIRRFKRVLLILPTQFQVLLGLPVLLEFLSVVLLLGVLSTIPIWLFILEDKFLVQYPHESLEACPHDFFCFFLDLLLVIVPWESEILWDPFLPYVILLTFGNPPWVIIFPNPLPVPNRDEVPYK